jgi:hypothetical protein
MIPMDWPSNRSVDVHSRLVLILLICIAGATAGCGSGSASSAGAPAAIQAIPPAITTQPIGQSVPMGLSATYSVAAMGSSLQYQWAKNGAKIAGATASSYTTPATAFTDTGANFTVTVSNSAGTALSNTASLTVTARAPMAGDLRFQQVDAPSTVSGWGNAGVGLSTGLDGRGAAYYSSSIGTPLPVGSAANCGTTPTQDGLGCYWFYTEVPLATSAAGPALITAYAADLYDSFEMDLVSPTGTALSFGNGVTPISSAAVITSLELEPADNLFALSWVQVDPRGTTQSSAQSTQSASFVLEQNTVAAADLSAAATQEGAASRVITAISVTASGAITYFAYGWQADTSTIYESEVVTASTPQTPVAAAALAANGYIITAIGQADAGGNVYLVGTRVQGDTMARPFMAAPNGSPDQLMQQGYAVVGVTPYPLGER